MTLLKKLNAWFVDNYADSLLADFRTALTRAQQKLSTEDAAVLTEVLRNSGRFDQVDHARYRRILSNLKRLIEADMQAENQRSLWHRFKLELSHEDRETLELVLNPSVDGSVSEEQLKRYKRILLRFNRYCQFFS